MQRRDPDDRWLVRYLNRFTGNGPVWLPAHAGDLTKRQAQAKAERLRKENWGAVEIVKLIDGMTHQQALAL